MRFRFGAYEFDRNLGELHRSGNRIALEAQPTKALALLLEKAGEAMSREELLSELWAETRHVDSRGTKFFCLGRWN